MELTQAEADNLIGLEKHYSGKQPVDFPNLGEKLTLELLSHDKREKFLLDITRGYINIRKSTYQNRVRTSIILVRLDLNGPKHRNPDGEEISSSHIHIYCEGYGDKYAYDITSEDFVDKFTSSEDLTDLLYDFMKFCNVTKKPNFQKAIL